MSEETRFRMGVTPFNPTYHVRDHGRALCRVLFLLLLRHCCLPSSLPQTQQVQERYLRRYDLAMP